MTETDEGALAERHAAKMRRRKALQDAKVAAATEERGLLIVHTGAGKGKSSAAFGMVMRHLGWGWPVGIVQFIKGTWDTGEGRFLRGFPDLVTLNVMGEGFTWDVQDRERDVAAARAAWRTARELIADDRHRLVLLDELNVALRYEYLPVDEVVAFLRDERPAAKHVVVTGRNAPPALLEAADLATEMTLLKHPFRAGVKAQKGVEF